MVRQIKVIFSIFALSFCLYAHGVKTPEVTLTFVKSVEQLAILNPADVNQANQLQQQIQRCFLAVEQGGINIVNNDLFLIGAYSNNVITGQRYSIKLKQLIFDDRKLAVSNEILSTDMIKKPDQGKDVPHLYCSFIKKTMLYDGRTSVVWQRISVPYENKSSISEITSSDKKFEKKDIKKGIDEENMTASQLLDLAAEYYTNKDYVSAFNTYMKLTQKFDSNAEGWYRLAIMAYQKKGCKYVDHRAVARDYMIKARDRAKGDMLEKAKDVLYYWEHPNFF
jgi:hypothetical protein